MPKTLRLKPLTALGFLDFNVLRQLLAEKSSDPVHCVEYALRNIADCIPIRNGGGRIQWYPLKHLISADAERFWTSDVKNWDELEQPGFFLGNSNARVILAQGAFYYSTPYGLKERRQMEARSKVIKLLLDGVKVARPRFKSALKGLSVLTTSERRALNSKFYAQFAKVRMMEGDHFDDSIESFSRENDDGNSCNIAERLKTDEPDEINRNLEDGESLSELYSLHEHVLGLICKVRRDRGNVKIWEQINLGEIMISGLTSSSVSFLKKKESLWLIRYFEWAKS